MAQLVARYLGVVEAASSSLVTQTSIKRSDLSLLFCYIAKVPTSVLAMRI